MQSEGGAAGALHGTLQAGALATTFTASQGLLLMIPNMYKIAGELTPVVFHVAARSLATQGLSIFGDHSDVMAVRPTGFALLYLDVVAALQEEWELTRLPRVIGGRYGLSSKEFTPAMVKGIYDEMQREDLKKHFTIGIHDDVTLTSLDYDPTFALEDSSVVQCVFWGLGSDGTVGANKNSIKIIGEETTNFAQGYFVYDSKKSGSVTISHLRFGSRPFSAPYLIGMGQADFVACHQFAFLERFAVLKYIKPGGVFLLDSMHNVEEVWNFLPQEVQREVHDKHVRLYVIDAHKVAAIVGMGGRINTIMQTCFFAISGILPREEAIAQIKKSIRKTYGKRGEAIVQKNYQAVDEMLVHLYEVAIPVEGVELVPMVGASPEVRQ